MFKIFQNILCLTFIITIISCNRKYETYEVLIDNNFFNYEIGKYIIYDVDSMYWDDFTKTYTVKKMQMKYECTDTFTSENGFTTYVITIESKDSNHLEYRPDFVDFVQITNDKIVYTNQNLKYINLVFPIEDNKSWDGLAMITRDREKYPAFYSNEWEFKYKNINKDKKIGNNTYKNTVEIEHIDYSINDPDEPNTSFAEKIYSNEIYGKGIGLLYKEFIYWEYQQTTGFQSGYGVKMAIKETNWK